MIAKARKQATVMEACLTDLIIMISKYIILIFMVVAMISGK